MAILTTGNTFATNDQVTSTKLNNIVNAATWDDPADGVTIEVSANKLQVKTIQTGNIAASAVTTAKIADATTTTDGITDAKLRHSAGLSVVGRGSNTTGAVADITAGSDYHVLRRSGTSVAFGQITPNSLTQWMTSGTAQMTTSGTSIDFTSIPSWVKRITVLFSGVSTSGTSPMQAQLGTSSGPETTGYAASNTGFASIGLTNVTSTSGFYLTISNSYQSAANTYSGSIVFSNISGNVWVCSASLGGTTTAQSFITNGAKSLAGTLDRVRITTANGTDTFDAGTINIIYE